MAASIDTTTPTPTRRPDDDTLTGDRAAQLHRLTRVNRRLALLLVAAVVAIAAVALFLDTAPSTTRANAASTARWNEAATQYEAIRRAAALDADAARLTRQADVRAGR